MPPKLGAGKTAEMPGVAAQQTLAGEPHDAAVVLFRIVAIVMRPRLVGPEQAAAQHIADDRLAAGKHERDGAGSVAGRGQNVTAEPIWFERNALLKNQIGLEGFEGFVHERPEEAREVALGGEHAIAPVAHEGEIAVVQGDLRPAEPAQLGGAAGRGTVAVRKENQRELLDFQPVILACGKDPPQIPGRPGIDQHWLFPGQEITVRNRAFDPDEHFLIER